MTITRKESLVARVERVLCEAGFETRSCRGPSTWILLIKSRKVHSCFFFWKVVDYSVGTVYLDCSGTGARPAKNWVIRVRGKEHMDPIDVVAKKFEEEFKVDIHIELESDKEDEIKPITM